VASFILTAGFVQSLPTVLIGEGILRAGHQVSLILVVSPWQPSRLYRVLNRRGLEWFTKRLGLNFHRSSMLPSRLEFFAREMGIRSSKIRAWADKNRVPVNLVKNLNSPEVIAQLEFLAPDAVIYSGGGILREAFIRTAGITLNAHSGPLPEIRGMNAAEWAYLLGARREITIHHIDEGIDTGAVVSSRTLNEQPADVDDLRALSVLAGIEEMISVIEEGRWRIANPVIDASPGRQCFVMARAIREILNSRLESGS